MKTRLSVLFSLAVILVGVVIADATASVRTNSIGRINPNVRIIDINDVQLGIGVRPIEIVDRSKIEITNKIASRIEISRGIIAGDIDRLSPISTIEARAIVESGPIERIDDRIS